MSDKTDNVVRLPYNINPKQREFYEALGQLVWDYAEDLTLIELSGALDCIKSEVLMNLFLED